MPKGKHPTRHGYKSADRHRYRKVFVWIIPLIFAVMLAVASIARDRLFAWSVILAAAVFLGYSLFLMEWYVWKENPARRKARIVFASIAVLCAMIFHYWLPSQSPVRAFLLGERPSVEVVLADLAEPKAGKQARVSIGLYNRGEAPAYSVKAGGRVIIREHCPPNSCPPIVEINKNGTFDPTDQSLGVGETKFIVSSSDEVLSENSIEQIVSGKAALMVFVFTEYGRDGKTTPYHLEYYAYFDHRVMRFVKCHIHNTKLE